MSSAGSRSSGPSPSWLDDDTLQAVRPQVRKLLESSQGFRDLPAAQQQELARNMVRVASYMSNPDGLAKQELTPGKGVLARAQDAVEDAKGKASAGVGRFAGADFKASSVAQGAENFRKYVGDVDFPKFVGGLIQNVFQAIVDASIQQMKAYGDLLKAVAQTVDQFAQDNITSNNARDWLVERFPDSLTVDTSDTGDDGKVQPKLALKDSADASAAGAQISQELQLAKPVGDISDAAEELRVVQAARLQIARSRQQMLSSMVLLGINRIVVTDGSIKAKVVFDFRALDTAQRDARASLYDGQSSENTNTTSASVGIGWIGGASTQNVNTQKHMTTVSSSVSETSKDEQEMKAKLTGEVNVNFKSDYFPMEKLASPGMIAAIQGNSKPVDPNVLPSKQGDTASPGSAAH